MNWPVVSEEKKRRRGKVSRSKNSLKREKPVVKALLREPRTSSGSVAETIRKGKKGSRGRSTSEDRH